MRRGLISASENIYWWSMDHQLIAYVDQYPQKVKGRSRGTRSDWFLGPTYPLNPCRPSSLSPVTLMQHKPARSSNLHVKYISTLRYIPSDPFFFFKKKKSCGF